VSVLERIPFVAALAILAAGTVVGVYVAARTHEWVWLVVALVLVGAFAVQYLREYSRLLGPETAVETAPESERPAPPPPAPDQAVDGTPSPPGPPEEPAEVDTFDPDFDPVAEADRLERRAPPAPPADK
jgi:hypothetical protein